MSQTSSDSSNQSSTSSSKPEYRIAGEGTNSLGNRWQSYNDGTQVPNENSYHYSNRDGSYYYSNPNGSTYYNNSRGFSEYKRFGAMEQVQPGEEQGQSGKGV